MKKVISVALALVMMFSLSVFAFAANDTVALNETKTFTLKKDTFKRVIFTADEAGVYKVEVELKNQGFVNVEVAVDGVEYDNTPASNLYDPEEGLIEVKAELYICANDGSEIEITATDALSFIQDVLEIGKDIAEDAQVTLKITKAQTSEIKLGKNQTANGDCWFTFVPEKSGYYNFASNAEVSVDPDIIVYSLEKGAFDVGTESGRMIDEETFDANFDLTVYLEAGKFYAFNVCTYNRDYELIDAKITFEVAFNKDIKAEKISLDNMPNGEKIVMDKNDEFEFNVFVVPTGAIPTAKVNVSVSNDSVISAEYDEENNVVTVLAKKQGTSKITVTTDDGASCEYTIKVQSPIVTAIQNMFSRISFFFYMLRAILFGGLL